MQGFGAPHESLIIKNFTIYFVYYKKDSNFASIIDSERNSYGKPVYKLKKAAYDYVDKVSGDKNQLNEG